MNLDFFAVMSNLISLFSLIAVGYIAVRSKILDDKVSREFSALLLKITLPCTIFISLVQREYNSAFVHDSIVIVIAGVILYTVILYASRYVAILLKVPEKSRGVWAFTCAFSNSGFMGFPIALALFGGEGLALAVMMNISLNIVLYTLGALEISRNSSTQSTEKLNIKSIIFSNINVAIVLSLIFYFGRIKLPEIVATPISYLSGITTPLSMIIIGMALSHSNGFEVFTDKYAWECTVMRLVIVPSVLCLVFKFFPLSDNPLVSAVFIIAMAMPAASITTALTELYNGDVTFAAKIMFIQNLFCIITIPVVCMTL